MSDRNYGSAPQGGTAPPELASDTSLPWLDDLEPAADDPSEGNPGRASAA